ncbi:Hypothetical protein PBC10988_8760 [Planctomycetales bacterium 10988]|nr:Hypothetical protein PBC10988_8760 [Planctomycetales bacterium 10988]
MRTVFHPLCCGIVLWGILSAVASAQYYSAPTTGYPPIENTPGTYQASLAGPYRSQLFVRANGAENGIGYEGSYGTLGGTLPVTKGPLGAYWLAQGNVHLSENGGFFSNVGFGPRIRMEQWDSVFGISMWYDYDDDKYELFGHDFHQLGVSFEWMNPILDWRLNGYFPVGDADFTTDGKGFRQNRILIQNGIDSAMRGFDTEVGGLLKGLEAWATRGYIGGYYYRSDVVERTVGFQSRLETHPVDGIQVTAQISYDDRFETTGFVGITYSPFGTRRLSPLERIYSPTVRNDHIVRYHQDPIEAINPITGLPYNVVHVQQGAGAAGDGSWESPYMTLAEAEAASVPFDIIFVGEGTYAEDITLQAGQRLLSCGIQSTIPTQIGLFTFPQMVGTALPTITNPGGAAVTIVANDNEVAGFNIISSNIGILATSTSSDLLVRGNNILGNNTGILLQGAMGTNVSLQNTISNSVGTGILSVNSFGDLVVIENTITGNGGAGIGLIKNDGFNQNLFVSGSTIDGNLIGVDLDVAGGSNLTTAISNNLSISNNTSAGIDALVTGPGSDLTMVVGNNLAIDSNGDDGVRVNANQVATADVTIQGNTIDSNADDGVEISANLTATINTEIFDNILTNNTFNGVEINSLGGSVIQAMVDTNTIDTNGLNGVFGTVISSTLVFSAENNTSISTNGNDGIFILGDMATLDITIADNLAITGNGTNPEVDGGNGVSLETINGTTVANYLISGNIISSSSNDGIRIDHRSDTRFTADIIGNTVDSNLIGLEAFVISSSTLDLNLDSNIFSNNGIGVLLTSGQDGLIDALFTNNVIDSSTSDGVTILAGSFIRTTFIGNTISNNGGNGIDFSGFAPAVVRVIDNNTIINNNIGINIDPGLGQGLVGVDIRDNNTIGTNTGGIRGNNIGVQLATSTSMAAPGPATIAALLFDNDLRLNGTGFLATENAANGMGTNNICVLLVNNQSNVYAFNAQPTPPAAGAQLIEVDVASTGNLGGFQSQSPPDITGTATCVADFNAIEAIFVAESLTR